jgi:hypothetical protein
MKDASRMLLVAVSLPLFLTACLNTTGSPTMQQGTVLVSEVVSVCGSVLGEQAEQRINQEWAKYPEAEVSRPMVESVANVLLSSPDATAEQGSNQYSKYMTCAAGLFATKEVMK